MGGGTINSSCTVPLTYYNFLHVMSGAKWMCSKWHYRFPQCYPVLKAPIKAGQLLPETRELSMPRFKKKKPSALCSETKERKRKRVFEEWMQGRGKLLSSPSRYFGSWRLSWEDVAVTLCRHRRQECSRANRVISSDLPHFSVLMRNISISVEKNSVTASDIWNLYSFHNGRGARCWFFFGMGLTPKIFILHCHSTALSKQ